MTVTPTDYPDPVVKHLWIAAPPAAVWRALTDPALAPRWMSDEPLTIDTDWRIGGPIRIGGTLHGRLRFVNTGHVRAFDPPRRLEYTHYSSLSRRALPDTPEHHAVFAFELEPDGAGTRMRLTLRNLSHYAVYGHLNYYWEIALAALKRECERAPASGPIADA
ncbi:SRPBCC family protein [Lysobacter enzymogenes]|nr:SRPBCC domain-containing protein [Lysobacter enzymogenes]